jgi:hypothetical protein
VGLILPHSVRLPRTAKPHLTSMTSRVLLCSLALAASSHAVVIYTEDFNGSGSASLNGAAPTTAVTFGGGLSSATWSAHNGMLNNGAPVNAEDSSAVLAFTPTAGNIYTLTVDLTSGSVDNDWIGFGFVQTGTVALPGTSAVTNAGRFTDVGQLGALWVLARESVGGGTGDVEFFVNGTAFPITTTETDASFDGLVKNTLSIVFDATALTADLRVNGTSVTGGAVAVPGGLTLAGIAGVGITHNNTTLAGTAFDNFSLSAVPEPSAALLGLVGMLGLLRRRRL